MYGSVAEQCCQDAVYVWWPGQSPLCFIDANWSWFWECSATFRVILLDIQSYSGLKGVVPSDPYTAKGLLTAAIRDDDPVVYFEHKGLYLNKGAVPEESYVIPLGKARTVKPGKDITLVGISRMTWVCTEAAEELQKEGVDAEVIDLLSVSPIDYDHIIDSVRRTHRLVVVDEDTPVCSLASDICARVAEEAFDYLDAPPSRVTAPHTPVPYSRPLENNYVPNAGRVVRTVQGLVS